MQRLNLNAQQIVVEDFDHETDNKFIKESLVPYFRDLFRDLALRCMLPQGNERKIDKVTFIQYCQLPGIINDRLFNIFDNHKDGQINENSFINSFVSIFMSDIDTKLKLTFNMYDFNSDGLISEEDVRIVLSYVPFKKAAEVQGFESMSAAISRLQAPFQEGLYNQDQGKDIEYKDRVAEQEEIKKFLQYVFASKKEMNLQEYKEFNGKVSSEMFFSLMSLLHEQLPCSQNFFRLKKIYRTRMNSNFSSRKSQSPARVLASPNLVRGLSSFKKAAAQAMENSGSGTPGGNLNSQNSLTINSQLSGSMTPTVVNSPLYKSKKGLDINKIRLGSNRGSNMSSAVNSQFMDSDEYNYEEHKQHFEEINNQDDEGYESGSTLKIPLSKYKMLGTTEEPASPGGFMKYRNKDFSPVSPSKANVIRTGLVKDQSALFSPKVSNQQTLPSIKGTASSKPSTFSKKVQADKTFSSTMQGGGGFGSSLHIPQKAHQINQARQFAENYSGSGSPNSNYIQNNYATYEQEIIENFGHQREKKYVFHEGESYLKTKSDRYKAHWVMVMGNELYCYRHKGDTEHRAMHCLVGTFIKELPQEKTTENGTLWPIKITLPPNKSRVLYFKSQTEQQKWGEVLKESIGYANLFDYYEVSKPLGKGQFGLVQLAQHKRTNQKVAIKTVKKKDMKPIEVYQQRREIEVLKMCQHPNIIKLLDLFENSDYYYIVLEYMEGKDLFDYLKARNFSISEDRARHLALQIAEAIQYLHSYGIVHRDIKLENVMMSDTSEKSIPKLVDFGLAKIIGPSEKTTEPFGTLGYVAPEVLKKEPYTFSCDLWSLGCITYALLSGSLPFDHESQKETIRMTLHDPLVFDLPVWDSVSDKAKNFIEGLLQKNPNNRLSLKEALAHPWLAKHK